MPRESVISQALVEHYMRTLGYRIETHSEHRYWVRGADDHSLPFLGDPDAMVCLLERRMDENVRYRLGLCAASETVRKDWDHLGGDMGDCGGIADQLLRAAGVDPGRWEEARR